jgi:hypothetical protein
MQHISIHAIHHHKRRPMQRIWIFGADSLLCGNEGGTLGSSNYQVLEKLYHQELRGFVGDLPKAHYDSLRARLLESSLQSENAVAGNLAESRLTRRKNNQIQSFEIKTRYFFGGQDAVVRTFGDFIAAFWVEGRVCTGE